MKHGLNHAQRCKTVEVKKPPRRYISLFSPVSTQSILNLGGGNVEPFGHFEMWNQPLAQDRRKIFIVPEGSMGAGGPPDASGMLV
jgi:hypothetical protein